MKVSCIFYFSSTMKNYLLLLYVFLLWSSHTTAQDSTEVRLYLKYYNDLIDIKVQKFDHSGVQILKQLHINDTLKFNIPKQQGVYRLQMGKVESGNYVPSNYIDLIVNGIENRIVLSIDASQKKWLPNIIESNENKMWYLHKQQQQQRIEKIQAINNLVANYPNSYADDALYQLATVQLQQTQEQYGQENATFCSQHPNTWAALVVKNTPFLTTNPKDDFRLQKFQIHDNFWNTIDTQQEKLLQTPLYTDAILSYIGYYMDPDFEFSETEMTAGFIKCCDVIMDKFKATDNLRRFALNYLTLGFKEIAQEKVVQHLDETYRKEIQCTDTSQQSELERRLMGYATLKPGTKAPAIEWTAANGSKQSLYTIKATFTLVVFWASWCPHCMEQMPQLHAALANNSNVKVVAISLDDDAVAYQNASANFPNFITYCDFKKWSSTPVEAYYIAATPTFFLLDKDKKIIDKYATYESAIEHLNNKMN